MIRDIVFEENYAKKVEQINQQAFQQGYAQGRQSGWNEMFSIVMHLQSTNELITQEKVIGLINQMLLDEKQQEQKT